MKTETFADLWAKLNFVRERLKAYEDYINDHNEETMPGDEEHDYNMHHYWTLKEEAIVGAMYMYFPDSNI